MARILYLLGAAQGDRSVGRFGGVRSSNSLERIVSRCFPLQTMNPSAIYVTELLLVSVKTV